MLQRQTSHQRVFSGHKLDLMGKRKNEEKEEEEEVGLGRVGRGDEYVQNILCKILRNCFC